jgi:coenzyme F420-reducing hydrogenase delta subunit
VEELDISEFHKLPQLINEFAGQIEEIGLNPFKT